MGARKDWTTTTLEERINFLREVRGDVSLNVLGERAGIASGPMSRLTKRPRPSAAKLGAIARAWRADLGWLASGTGPAPVAQALDLADRYPNRAEAARLAMADGRFDEGAITDVLGDQLEHESDLSVVQWLDIMRLREQMRRRPTAVGVEVRPGDVATPPRGRRKS